MRSTIAVGTLVIALGLVNWSIVNKEKHLAEGRTVYLQLAPVDPRSLMQGDYMALRFQIGRAIQEASTKIREQQGQHNDSENIDGFVMVKVDERGIGSFSRLSRDQAPSAGEVLMRYRIRNGQVKFATNAFFFQEGHQKYYQNAHYGQFRVDGKGELLLANLYDQDLNKLGPPQNS